MGLQEASVTTRLMFFMRMGKTGGEIDTELGFTRSSPAVGQTAQMGHSGSGLPTSGGVQGRGGVAIAQITALKLSDSHHPDQTRTEGGPLRSGVPRLPVRPGLPVFSLCTRLCLGPELHPTTSPGRLGRQPPAVVTAPP